MRSSAHNLQKQEKTNWNSKSAWYQGICDCVQLDRPQNHMPSSRRNEHRSAASTRFNLINYFCKSERRNCEFSLLSWTGSEEVHAMQPSPSKREEENCSWTDQMCGCCWLWSTEPHPHETIKQFLCLLMRWQIYHSIRRHQPNQSYYLKRPLMEKMASETKKMDQSGYEESILEKLRWRRLLMRRCRRLRISTIWRIIVDSRTICT